MSIIFVGTVCVLFIAFLVQSAFGFGAALISVPLLALFFPVTLITPLLATLSLLMSLQISLKEWPGIEKELLKRLIISALIGVPIGTFAVLSFNATIVRFSLGLIVVLSSINALTPRMKDIKVGRDAAWVFGFVSGVLGGAYNFFGAPLAVYLQWAKLAPGSFRATMHAYSVLVNTVVLSTYWVFGAIDDRLGLYFSAAIGPVLLGGWLGGVWVRRVNPHKYRALLNWILLALGASLMYSAIAAK